MDEQQYTEWTPAPPPRGERLLFALQRYGFPLALLAVLAAAVLFLVLYTPPAGDEVDAAELEALLRQHRETRLTPSSVPETTRSSSLFIESEPPGATVYWDMDSIGTTPLARHAVPTGAYVLRLAHAGYTPVDTFVIIPERAADVSLNLALQADGSTDASPPTMAATDVLPRAPQPERDPEPVPRRARSTSTSSTGWLAIGSNPNGASVLIDGAFYGKTPHALFAMPKGPHAVTLQRDGFQQHDTTVVVAAGDTTYVHQRLEANTGTLNIIVRPWGTIYIDDVLHARATDVQYETSLSAGYHVVRAEHPALGTREQAIHVREGQTTDVVLHMHTPQEEAAHNEQDHQQEDYQ